MSTCKVHKSIFHFAWKPITEATTLQLFVNNSSNTPVAVFHPKRCGIFQEGRPASLEIFPAGEHMVDLIVVTFVYVETLRRDRKNRSQSSGG